MALAYAQSLGDGTTRVFTVPFPYLSKTHVQVKVNGVAVSYTWLSETSIQTATAPAAGAIVDRRRVTPRDTVMVDFVDGSTLVESDLDLATLQVFYLAQEAFDLGEASLGVTEDGSFSALQRRIANLLDPTQPQDAVNKRWAETAMTSQLVQATQKASDAASSASASANSATASAGSASTATTQANTATTKASEAAASATAANTSKNTATTKASEAAASAADALASKNAAAASADAAAQSAQDAALFDPSSYYTKTEIDTSLGTKLNSSAYTAADVLAKIKTVDGAGSGLDADTVDGLAPSAFPVSTAQQTALNAKADSASPQITGMATITGGGEALRIITSDTTSDPYLSFWKATVRQGYIQHRDGSGDAAGFRIANDLSGDLLCLPNDGGIVFSHDGTNYREVARMFTSGQLAVTFGGLLTVAHGLGYKPTQIAAYWTPTTSYMNWSNGQEMLLGGSIDHSGSEAGYGVALWADATNIYCRMGAVNVMALIPDRNTGAGSSSRPSAADSKLILKAS
ncbi:phage tail fiber domain-containing protein [Rhizobium mongolense]|nr:phage tail fiber protein [Rhizobium mongolense]